MTDTLTEPKPVTPPVYDPPRAIAAVVAAAPADALACQDWMPGVGNLTLLIHAGRRDAVTAVLRVLDGWGVEHCTSDRHEATWAGVLYGVAVRIHLLAKPTRIWPEAA